MLSTIGFLINLPFEQQNLNFLDRWLAPALKGAPEISESFGGALALSTIALVIAIVTIGLFSLFLLRTRTGRAMRAVAQDEAGAQMAGISLNRIFVLTMGLSCGLAALAGASLLFVFPWTPEVGQQPLYLAWYVVILAGLGNVQGAIIGAFIVSLIQTLSVYYVGVGWVDVMPTVFIILILLFRPSGLFGSEVKGVWEQ